MSAANLAALLKKSSARRDKTAKYLMRSTIVAESQFIVHKIRASRDSRVKRP